MQRSAKDPNRVVWTGGGGGALVAADRTLIPAVLSLLTVVSLVMAIRALVNHDPLGWLLLAFAILAGSMGAAYLLIFRRTSAQRITLDLTRAVLEFEHVFLLAGFFPRIASFACSLAEVRRVEHARGKRGGLDWLIIHTPSGRVVLHSASHNFDEFRRVLMDLVQNRPVPLTSRSWFPAALASILVFGALAVALWMGWLP